MLLLTIQFQHTAARRRLEGLSVMTLAFKWFQHTAARRRLDPFFRQIQTHCSFNTQPPEGGWLDLSFLPLNRIVSTHSRPKAAGFNLFFRYSCVRCFNTQPPEGGWLRREGKNTI